MLKGFRDFLMRGNVVDLAIAVIIGAASDETVLLTEIRDLLAERQRS
jgi:large-conductance mechanosensitive channel